MISLKLKVLFPMLLSQEPATIASSPKYEDI